MGGNGECTGDGHSCSRVVGSVSSTEKVSIISVGSLRRGHTFCARRSLLAAGEPTSVPPGSHVCSKLRAPAYSH